MCVILFVGFLSVQRGAEMLHGNAAMEQSRPLRVDTRSCIDNAYAAKSPFLSCDDSFLLLQVFHQS